MGGLQLGSMTLRWGADKRSAAAEEEREWAGGETVGGAMNATRRTCCREGAGGETVGGGDSEVVQCIKEMLVEFIRPIVVTDGGDVEYVYFN